MTEDKVFQLINVSLSFRWARRFCLSQFSVLPVKESLEDEEGVLRLLRESQLQEPIWVVDRKIPLVRESVAISKQCKQSVLNFKSVSV